MSVVAECSPEPSLLLMTLPVIQVLSLPTSPNAAQRDVTTTLQNAANNLLKTIQKHASCEWKFKQSEVNICTYLYITYGYIGLSINIICFIIISLHYMDAMNVNSSVSVLGSVLFSAAPLPALSSADLHCSHFRHSHVLPL